MSVSPGLYDDNLNRRFENYVLELDFEKFLTRRKRNVVPRPWRFLASNTDTGSTILADKYKFQVHLDVQQFKLEEISVRVSGYNTITVEGKHEGRQDEHGSISRHFVRKYVLPEGHDINQVVSNLSSDGVLTIAAPRVVGGGYDRIIPIQETGIPLKSFRKEK